MEKLRSTTKISQGYLSFRLEGNRSLTGQDLRAAIARLCPQYPQLAQRTSSGKLIYRHPHVQFKVMDGAGVITAIGEEAEILIEVFATIPEIICGGKRLRIVEKKIEVQDVSFGPAEKEFEYVFVSPWLALNQKNEKVFFESDGNNKRSLLNRVLVGNILSMAKGLGFFLIPNISATVYGRWSESPSFFKGVQMKGIRCRFRAFFEIPHLWGIGKSSSSGWGTIVKLQGGLNVA